MYEKNLKGNEVVRQLRFRQARVNNDERRGLYDAIEDLLPYAPLFKEFGREITVRFEHEGWHTFRAIRLRRSEHFPFMVPELVNEYGDFLLITYLSYGSLLRLKKMLS